MVELGYGRTWTEKIAKIKAGEKLGVEPQIRKIVFEISYQRDLSDIEQEYLLSSIFGPSRKRVSDDD